MICMEMQLKKMFGSRVKWSLTKSAFRCTMTTTEGTRGRGTDRHEEKVIKPGFRQPFMCSQTQTHFEVVRGFWAYISHNICWKKNEMIKVD